MARPPIPLGPFNLTQPIGRGGMGEVWQAVHRRQGVACAIKILAGEWSKDRWFQQAFQDEVRAVARLQHPAIVTVLDQGSLSQDAAVKLASTVLAGAPWLAMELVKGGTLSAWIGRLDWPQLRTVLTTLLDALAHAHARGVVHRDIKPANILVGRGPGAVLKLTDFGIAHLASRGRVQGGVRWTGGTPAYMAPEQFLDDDSGSGPWTDLYSLGCLAVELCTGTPPFGRLNFDDAAVVHATRPVPRLKALFPVPDGFEGWIRSILAKDPQCRYRRAADASLALGELGLALSLGDPRSFSSPPGEDDSTEGFNAETDLPQGQPLAPIRRPPVPTGWEQRDIPAPDLQLLGAGQGLYGVRTIPMVGRKTERDLLWGALRAVDSSGAARCVVLKGPSGVGATRLATWLGETAHEVGAATFLVAEHGPFAEGARGWPAMLARHLHCEEAPPEVIRARLERFLKTLPPEGSGARLAAAEVASLLPSVAALLAPEILDTGAGRRLTAQERHGMGVQVLRWLARERPLVMLLDDVQWSTDALRFVIHVLEASAASPLPVLLILTVEEEARAEQAEMDRLLEELQGHGAVTQIHVAPLPQADSESLLKVLLRLDGDLAARVTSRMAGNPLFAVHLVGEWVDRGVLIPGPTGFTLAPDAPFALPDDLHVFWNARLDHLSHDLGAGSVSAFEVAAALGLQVRLRDWIAICRIRGLDASRGMVAELETRRLAVLSDTSWRFVSPLLRAALERRSREAGRWAEVNRTCARVLTTLWPRGHMGLAEQVARHYLEAQDLDQAVTALRQAAQESVESESFSEAQRLLHQRAGLLKTIGVPIDDPRWTGNELLRAELAQRRGNYDEAILLLDRLIPLVRDAGQGRMLADAFLVRARIHYQRADLEEVRRQVDAILPIYEAEDQALGLAEARLLLARTLLFPDTLPAAEKLLEQALKGFESRSAWGRAMVRCAQAQARLMRADPAGAQVLLEDALRIQERIGSRFGEGYVQNQLGEVARYRGDMVAAERAYRAAWEALDQLGSPQGIIPYMNLAVVEVEGGELAAARRIATTLLPRLQKLGWKAHIGYVHGIMAAVTATEGTDEEFQSHVEQALVLTMERVEHDLPRCLEVAGTLSSAAGAFKRARVAWNAALGCWRRLGRGTEARRVEQALAGLPGAEGGTADLGPRPAARRWGEG